MKSFFKCFILCGLVFLVGCSGDSPKQPTTTSTVTSDVWQITSLVASDDNPLVNTSVLATATVTLNGDPAPDGTTVEFTTPDNGGVAGFSNGQYIASVLSTGGTASIGFGAVEKGTYLIEARVRTVRRSITIAFREPDTSGGLQLWNINPAEGSYAGGEPVVLTGKGIRNPVEVYFTVQGTQYQAIVDQVVPSVPSTSAGTISIRSPEPTAADTEITSTADVRVVVGVGTTDEEQQSYPAVFTYVSDSVTLGDPVIFGVDPYYGSSQGGEIVTILGLNFASDVVTKELVQNFDEVYFTFQGQDLLTQVERWSANQIEVITPRFSLTPLDNDLTADIKLVQDDGDTFIKTGVFIVQSDIAQPNITGMSPTAGPMDGGTIVTLTGNGFEIPVQVLFGDLEATDVQVFDDQSLADNDVITCRTPDYSQQGQAPPYGVAVRVTNLQTGLNSTAPGNFTYGSNLYVGQANPTEGQIGDLLTLYGSGFEDPLTVWFNAGGEIEFDVIAVTGTELTLRSSPTMAPTCNDRSGNFRVVLNESNQEATGGNYTLLGSRPTITNVDPIFVEEIDNGNGVLPGEIDIYGVRFAEDLLVQVGDYVIDPSDVTVISDGHLHVSQIPSPNDLFLSFETTACTTDTGLEGIKEVPTPVDVSVENLPVGCSDTLRQALVYVPEDETCRAAPQLVVNIGAFEDTQAGTCSPAVPLVIDNQGEGSLAVQSLFLQGRFFFDAGANNQSAGPITVPPFSSNNSFDLYFCPDAPTGTQYNGQLTISSNDSDSPQGFGLSGTEATPPEIGTSPYGNGDTWTFPAQSVGGCTVAEVLTITNSGVSDLTLQSVSSSDNTQFHIINAPAANTVLAPAATFDLQVEFCPGGAGNQSANLTIDHDATNEPDPIQISLAGNGT